MKRSSPGHNLRLAVASCAVLCLGTVPEEAAASTTEAARAEPTAQTAAEAEGGESADEAEPGAQPTGETLLDDDFTALELFEGIKRLRPRVRLSQDFLIDQDFGSTDVDRFESGFEASAVAPISNAFVIRLVGEASGAYYDFRGDEGFLDTNRSGDPFDSLMSTQLRLEGRYQFAHSWTVVGGTEFSSAWEEGSGYDHGIRQGGFAGVGHLFGERFSAVVGLGVRSHMGRSGVSVGPVFQTGWRVTDDIEIETNGLTMNVAAQVNPDLTLYLRGGQHSESYRLGDRGDDVDRGVLRDRNVPVQLGARWKLTKRWRVRAFVGAVFYQQYTVYDSDGDRHDSETTTDPAFTGNLELEYRF